MMNTIKPVLFALLLLPSLAFAEEAKPFTTSVANVLAAKGTTSAEAVVKGGSTTVISPRTGIRYTLGDTNNRPITVQTAAITAATTATVQRIVASNPALSSESQEMAEKTLLAMP
ncbi:hypothetical protein [Acinetobacter sp. MD2(2019)]|uniref:hypothetical protein n=1 Tax=Acinetobacter sp. MD2(2019) TaxID=2605273 RepID=UPI002D1EC099|nr:hypothetical protein [Acinetobacter sp. MD2(2019)]MEB3754698.1 hypothetical protein [Acinetobacter sp. MD2(2019)]